jgi:hypothetical protein
MNDDYLWDRSGEPDPEIQQLEEILGTLRYQPKPLKLAPRRNYLALLAIAATFVIALVAGGLWLLLPRNEALIPSVAFVTPVTPIPNPPLSVASDAPRKHKPVLVRHVVKQESQEALAAKQQLMVALRLASEKLNSAYRRTQTSTQIKNQHRAG